MALKNRKEILIGLSAVIAIAVTFFGIEYLKGTNILTPTNHYYALYTDVAGLQQSAPVMLNGFKVGSVRDINYDYDNPGHIKVQMALDKELKLPRGTKAVLTTDMLGTASIVIQLAQNTTDKHAIGDQLIGVNAPSLMSSINHDIMPGITAILPKIDSLLVNINKIVADPAISESLVHLKSTMENVDAGSKNLNRAMASMPTLATDAGYVVKNAKDISDNLSTIAQDLTTVSGRLKEMPLQETMANVEQASSHLKEIIGHLDSKDSSLGMLINDPTLYNNLTNASASLDSLLIDVKKNPKRYISIKLL